MTSHPALNREDHRDFFRVTNKLYKLRHNPGDLTNSNYRDILIELCSALNGSLDKGLLTAITSLNAVDATVRQQAKDIVSDFDRFTEVMLFAKAQLLECGIEKDTAQEIIQYAESVRAALRRTDFTPEAAADAVKACRDKICKGAGQSRFRMTQRGVNRAFGAAAMSTAGVVLLLGAMFSTAGEWKATPEASIMGGSATILIFGAGRVRKDDGKKG